MVKVGAVIQVRLGSERLPGKALLPLPFSGGPGLLEHVVGRAAAAAAVQQVIVATTILASDDPVETYCHKNGITCFRGSVDDVLERFVQAAAAHKLEVVVRLTGDNPFIMPATINEAVQQHLRKQVDYSITEGLPLGTNIEVVSFKALKQAMEEATETTDREHVTPFMKRGSNFTTQVLPVVSAISKLRLTIDYPADYALASLLYSKLYKKNYNFDFAELEQVVQENPWLAAINEEITQRKAFASEQEEVAEAKRILKQGGYTRVLQKLESNTHDK
ncbi:glycosyltransferase family protein [Pontibacter chitinilyticus]|uniref:glycosyltransferase family protein n=1 Tax=Pontibacter chitinilyticus TaxID=2674989 RepID=UPI00321BEFA2